MEVYIEYVLLDNLIINSVLLDFTNKTLKLKVNKFRIFLSAMLGTIVAIILPFVKLSNSILVILKVILCICMSAILKNHKRN